MNLYNESNCYQLGFEKLVVWKEARLFISKIYEITKGFTFDEKYGLTNQIRRAAVSVSGNIAEGSSRTSPKDQAHFTQLAYGSLIEVLSHLYVALDLSYLTSEDFEEVRLNVYKLSNQLNALRKAQLKRLNK